MTVHSGEINSTNEQRLRGDNRVYALLRLLWKGEISLRDTVSSITAYGYPQDVVEKHVRAQSFERVSGTGAGAG
jgi:hypothetical protein